jgi:hypothetical protein
MDRYFFGELGRNLCSPGLKSETWATGDLRRG